MTEAIDPRARYLAIATRCFADRGFHGTSLATLAKGSGVTKQALLHFFGTKERLYGEVLTALANRLSSKINEIEAGCPEDRLIAYFDAHASGALAQPDDSRLVIRALLDSDASARVWPLKSYLEQLVTLTQQTRRWQGTPEEECLAGLYRLIGAIQYFAISTPALTGMYGERAETDLAAHFADKARAAVRAFVGIS